MPTPWVALRSARDATLLEMPAQVLAAPEAQGVVVPPSAARIMRVLVRPGQRVVKGAPLVEVVMPQLVAAAGAYLSSGTRMEAYARRKAQLESLRAEGLARTADLSDAETRLAEARADHQAAQATLQAAGVVAADAGRVVERNGTIALRSPIAGIIVEVNAALGETRDAAGAPLVRVAGDSVPRIEARVSHAIPTHARYELLFGSGQRVPVRFVSQAPQIDPRDGTRRCWFEADPATPLAGGLTGRLRVLPAADANVLVAPATAVRGGAVIKREGDHFRRVEVTVLASSGADALIDGPLAAGDEVAADAARLVDGGAP